MRVIITGGAGFVGTMLARRLIALGALTGHDGTRREIRTIDLFDVVIPERRPAGLDDRVTMTAGAITDKAAVDRLVGSAADTSIFHLASIVSGEGEQNFDLAIDVNLAGHLHLLEAARRLGSSPRYVFASSIAVFGGVDMPRFVGDHVKQTPQTTYGMTKAMGELLINDYTRKGFIDGRSARLPTVIVRPGKPNKAASSFASGLFREPLAGIECQLPVGRDTVMPVIGYRTVVDGIIRLHEADTARLTNDRAFSLPAIDAKVGDMIASLERVAKGRKIGAIKEVRDPVIERIVATWPVGSKADRAIALGAPRDPDLDSIVRAYIEDFVDA